MPKSPEQPEFKIGRVERERKPLIIVYRDNDLFREYVPFIRDVLEERGYHVELQAFPPETDEEEIKKWYLEHSRDLGTKNIIADGTSIYASGYNWEAGRYNLPASINLDELIQSATIESIMGPVEKLEETRKKIWESREDPRKLHEAKEEYLSTLGEIYKHIFSCIPIEKRKKMKVIILSGIFKGHHIFRPLIDHEPFYVHLPEKEKTFKRIQQETEDFANRMKQWITEAGITNVTIYLTGSEIPPETVEELLNARETNTYIIFDRHTHTSLWESALSEERIEDMRAFWGPHTSVSGEIAKKAALQLPLETFYNNAREKLGIQPDREKIREIIRRKIQKALE